MSQAFAQNSSRYVIAHEATSAKRLLDENEHIIDLVSDLARKGRFREPVQLQAVLERNVVYLVSSVFFWLAFFGELVFYGMMTLTPCPTLLYPGLRLAVASGGTPGGVQIEDRC
ncbi:uncharacterized protein DC041_0007950 [Schistosoma bovis]|uniref:SS18 N-terminal domain-containing protein n=1 Tax=Schistosoma bovis TaxID=6184 RepID=A0A430Q2Q2_SCHBO|nr:uncharacterized protein DC041_0007950 [Schistosoma bovis]